MKKQLNVISGSLLVLMATSLIGCGQSMQSASSGANGSNSGQAAADISKEMEVAEKANQDAQAAMAQAQAVLASIQDSNGNIRVDLFQSGSSGVSSKSILTPIIDKLRTAFNKVFAKVEVVKAKFNEARQALVVASSRLDANDPSQAALLAQITKQMAAIDSMEAKFRTSMASLAGKLDLVTAAFERILSGVTNFIPGLGWIINLGLDFLVMGEVRDFVAEIKMKLLSL